MADQRTVLITGSSRGLGLTFVEHYVKAGWKVIAGVRNPVTASKLAELQPSKVLELDVESEASILRAAEELKGEAIDVLINNAGIADFAEWNDASKDAWMKMYEINVLGPFLVTRAFQDHMKAAVTKRGLAKVINMSSGLGSIGDVSNSAAKSMIGYRASKAALNMINANLSLQLKAASIAVVAVAPGFVATDINGHRGVLTTDESVSGTTKLIENADMAATGKFFLYTGRELPW